MAADETATQVCTFELTAATNKSVSLTGGPSDARRVELVHHGVELDGTTAATAPVFFKHYQEEPVDDLSGGGADNEQVLLANERLVVNVGRGNGEPVWLEFYSVGSPAVSAILLPGGY